MDKEDGGPAFPVATWSKDQMRFVDSGMTLRDYFAAKAMHAEITTNSLSDANANALCEAAEKAGRNVADQMAFNAYEMADAMLRERAK